MLIKVMFWRFQALQNLCRTAWAVLVLLLVLVPSLACAHISAATGRFLSPDPSRFADSRNLYAYCANDPVNGYDPDGLLETQLHNEQQPASAALPSASNPISSATPSWSYAPDPTADGRYGYVNRTQGGAAATLLALGDMLGVTTLYEAMTGRNLATGQYMTAAEQQQSQIMSVVALAAMAIPVVALESRAGVGIGGLEARAAMVETEAAGAEIRAATMAAESVAPSSRALGQALEAAGFARPTEAAAHHIVAGGAEAAAPARAVLERFGISVNDAANGVFLPATRASANAAGAAVHSTVHTRAYYNVVNEALGQATTRQEAIEVLNAIRQGMLDGGL